MNLNDLASTSEKPNWVSTLANDQLHRFNAWPMKGDLQTTKNRIKKIVSDFRGAELVKEGDHFLAFEFTTLILRFVDDVIFVIDPKSNEVHFRSSSRVGYSDLGANRKRMEELTRKYLAQ